MGGFCLLRSGEPAEALRQRIERAARAVELPGPAWLDLPGGVAAAWPRLLTGEAQLWQASGGDWAIAAGSFVFDDLGGSRALAAFHAAMGTAPERLLPRTLGQFALLLRRGERVWLLHDRGGFMPVFQGDGLAATSFLLAAKLSDRLTPDPQALLEYVLSGVPLGDATPVRELRLLGQDSHLELGPDGTVERRRPPSLPSEPPWPDAATATDACLAGLREVIGRMSRALGGNLACGLSGGYDSRLLLALLRDADLRPALFVYGPADSLDVRIARAIAAGEGLPLEHLDKTRLPPLKADPAAAVHADFLAQDGYGQEGIFDLGGERQARALRVARAPLQLHGGGGETLRNFFYLPDRSISPRGLLQSFWGQFDPAALTPSLDAEGYFRGLEAKLAATLGQSVERLPRAWVEWLYPHFRCRAWVGRETGNNQRFAPAFAPFLEPPAVASALRVPLALKRYGRFEGALIARLDPKLAAYPSTYGQPLDGSADLRRRLAEALTCRRPPPLRHWSFRLKQGFSPPDPAAAFPPGLMEKVLPEGPARMAQWLRPERITEPEQRRRLLSAEYLLRYLGQS